MRLHAEKAQLLMSAGQAAAVSDGQASGPDSDALELTIRGRRIGLGKVEIERDCVARGSKNHRPGPRFRGGVTHSGDGARSGGGTLERAITGDDVGKGGGPAGREGRQGEPRLACSAQVLADRGELKTSDGQDSGRTSRSRKGT